MTRQLPLLLSVVMLSAAPAEDFIRHGDSAFEQGDYATALACYERAEERSVDPGHVAFNKATALYRLGRYREAELHYRYCLSDASDFRRARVLHDLGDALVQQSQGSDAELLQQAIRSYEQCLAEPSTNEELAASARANLDLAKQLLQQSKAKPKPNDPDAEPGDHKPTPKDKRPASQRNGGDPKPGVKPSTENGKQPADRSQMPIVTDETSPGRGNLPPIPDADDLQPLSPEDTAALLQREAQRIARERREQQQRSISAPSRRVMDW